MNLTITGKCSIFGGPDDDGVAPDEGLALYEPADLERDPKLVGTLFLAEQPPNTTGLARRLNIAAHYVACRWDYEQTPKDWLVRNNVLVRAPKTGLVALAQPADWGPNLDTGRSADLSPSLANFLGVGTDDQVEVTVALPTPPAMAAPFPDAIREAQSAYKPRLSAMLHRLEAARRTGARVFAIEGEELAGVLEEIDRRLEGIAFYLATKQRAAELHPVRPPEQEAKAGDARTGSMDTAPNRG